MFVFLELVLAPDFMFEFIDAFEFVCMLEFIEPVDFMFEFIDVFVFVVLTPAVLLLPLLFTRTAVFEVTLLAFKFAGAFVLTTLPVSPQAAANIATPRIHIIAM